MTKDEIIESWWPEGSGHSAYSSGACDGASKMYDHRQKEIDGLLIEMARLKRSHDDIRIEAMNNESALWAVRLDDAQRWWAMRWTQLLCEVSISRVTAGTEEIVEQLKYEMGLKAKEVLGNNAAAARVMEVEG